MLLFPVRLETRFRDTELLVRIYPDQLAVETHQAQLTAAEVENGRSFRQRYDAAGDDAARRDAWRVLAAGYGPPRAAWIAKQIDAYDALGENLNELPRDAWTVAPSVRMLPDRFLVTVYKDGVQAYEKLGERIPSDLPLMRSPQDATSGDDGLFADAEWIEHFDAPSATFKDAISVGMGMRIALKGAQPPFSQVVAVGLRESLAPARATSLVEDWIEGQHYTRGFEFLAHGTSTNNTGSAKSGHSDTSANADDAYATELLGAGASLDAERSNGGRLRHALGLPPDSDVFSYVRLASACGESYAREAQSVLWPVTGDYFLGTMLAGLVPAPHRQRAAEHFARYVRASGPLAAVRVGNLPYGVLPVTRVEPATLADSTGWTASPLDSRALDGAAVEWREFDSGLHRVLHTLHGRWLQLATRGEEEGKLAPVPRVAGSPDADRDLLRILAMEPRSTSYLSRPFVDERFVGSLIWLLRYRFAGAGQANDWVRRWVTAWKSSRNAALALLLELGVTDVNAAVQAPVLRSLGWGEGKAIDGMLVGDWLPYLRVLCEQGADAPANASLAVLYEMLWRALRAPEATQTRSTICELAGGEGVEHFDRADMDGLFRNSLDACTHRLDAWITSLATKRLEGMRAQRATGLHLGAYGWVENLDRADAAANAGGFVHAPSLSQAAAGALLRNAFLTHENGAAENPFRIDLTSERVALAARLLEGIREGQPLGALLGYQFERALHEAQLDRYIDNFRKAYPLVAGKEIPPTGDEEAAEAVAARNVVDGIALAEARRKGALDIESMVTQQDGLLDDPARQQIETTLEREVSRLREALDAVGDLLLTEGVFQAAQGNFDRAGAALDAAAGNARPPEIDSTRTPVSGSGLRHRVCVLMPGQDASAIAEGAGPRTQAEPSLAAWIASLLGDTAGITFGPDDAPATLADAQFEPIDFVYLSAIPPGKNEETDLERRLRYHLRESGGLAADAPVELHLDRAGGINEALEVARRLLTIVSDSATLRPDTFARPEDAEAHAFDQTAVHELNGRVADAWARLRDNVVEKLDPSLERSAAVVLAALFEASRFGIPGALPASADDPDLTARRERTHAEAQSQMDRCAVLRSDAMSATSDAPDQAIEKLQAAMKALFGDGFVVLPVFSLPGNGALEDAFQQNGLLGAAADDRILLWLQQAAETHKPLRQLEDALMVTEAWRPDETGDSRLSFDVAQLPFCEARPWQALADAEIEALAGDATGATGECMEPPVGERPRAVLSIVAVTPRSWDASAAGIAGLLVEEWTETIPRDEVTTGLSFQYNAPNSQAPHALLLAVPGTFTKLGTWSNAEIRAIVKETLDLAKVRLVDPDAMREVGALLPALFMPVDTARPGWNRPIPMRTLDETAQMLPTVG